MPKVKLQKEIIHRDGFRLVDGLYTSFVLYNPNSKKNQRITINPATPDLNAAIKFKNKIELNLGIVQARAKKRFEFLQKFNDQSALFDSYIKWRQKTAKNSWSEDVSRMRCYVFPYFIGILSLNHPALWYEHWQSFQDSLGEPIRNNTKTKTLSVNSKDNIIRAANSFITYVETTEGGSPIKRLPEFKFEEKGRRGAESVYKIDELKAVYEEFEKINPKYAALFLILANTGMRVSEAIGLLSTDININQIPQQEKWIFNSLKDKTDIFGFILLKSQPVDSNNLVIGGEVKRAPLKKRKRIAPEFNRVIPLIDLETTKKLALLQKEASLHDLLFEGCTYRIFYKLFTEIKTKLKLPKQRDIHSLRHTFATNFARLCDGDPRIIEKVLGHSDRKMTERYNHLAAELDSLANNKNNVIDLNKIKPMKI